jgi:hypothetical protein
MIKKYYEVYCDNCQCGINDYGDIYPSPAQLRKDDIIFLLGHHFCSSKCKEEFRFKKQENKNVR